jgi:hypothetical protein
MRESTRTINFTGRGSIGFNLFLLLRFKNGDRYKGSWMENKKHGKGVYYFSNGDRYEGAYLGNVRHGKGKYYYKSGRFDEEEYEFDKLISK